MGSRSLNTRAADIFRDCAEILRQQKANPFRINAYLRAAQTLESMDPGDSSLALLFKSHPKPTERLEQLSSAIMTSPQLAGL